MLRCAGVLRRLSVAAGVTLMLAGWAAPAEAKSRADKLFDEATEAEEAGNYLFALRKHEESCRLGNSYSCYNAGLSYYVGSKVTEDPPKALALYTRACDLDEEQDEACEDVGDFLSKGEDGITVDAARARHYYKRACDISNAGHGCAGFAKMALAGTGGQKDEVLARTYFMRACEGYLATGCNYALPMVYEGVGGAKDHVKAREFAVRGCRENGKSITSPDQGGMCTAAGNMYFDGEGGAKDEKASSVFFTSGCSQGHATGCHNLAILYWDGSGVVKDQRAAARMFVKACNLGSKAACALIKK